MEQWYDTDFASSTKEVGVQIFLKNPFFKKTSTDLHVFLATARSSIWFRIGLEQSVGTTIVSYFAQRTFIIDGDSPRDDVHYFLYTAEMRGYRLANPKCTPRRANCLGPRPPSGRGWSQPGGEMQFLSLGLFWFFLLACPMLEPDAESRLSQRQ